MRAFYCAALVIMISCLLPGCARAQKTAQPADKTPQYPVLTAFERYLDKMPLLDSKPVPCIPLNVKRPMAAAVYWQDADHLLTIMEDYSSGRAVFQVHDLQAAKTTDISGECQLHKNPLPLVDRSVIFRGVDGSIETTWYYSTAGTVAGCRVDLANGTVSDSSAPDKRASIAPLYVLFQDTPGSGDYIRGWRGRFTWYDTKSAAIIEGTLPDGLGAVRQSPLSLHWNGSDGVWAVLSFPLSKYPSSESEPATDITLLVLSKNGCSVKQTVRSDTIPLQRKDDWSVNGALDSPVWLTPSMILYRHVWSVSYVKGTHYEELHVWELRQQTVGRNDSKLLDMYAVYQSGPALYWSANEHGKFVEHLWDRTVYKRQSQVDLVPFPSPDGRSIAYIREGQIYTVEASK